MGKIEVTREARRRSGWAAASGVAITLGITEMFAGLSTSIPSAISSIGAVVVDITPPWLESFAISTFGTADKAVLAVSMVIVAIAIGFALGKRSAESAWPVGIGFVVFTSLGIAAQLDDATAVTGVVVVSTSIAGAVGLLSWYGIKEWAAPSDRDVTDGDVFSIERRRILLAVGAAATVSLVMMSVGRAKVRSRAEAQLAAVELPEPVEVELDPTDAHDFDLPLVAPIVVSNTTFYRIDTALVVPTVDPEQWTLRIHGMVDEEIILSYQDILAMPLIEKYATLTCVSNQVGDRLIGNALWTGVPLPDLLNLAGVQPGADQIVGRSIDGWTAGFPTEIAFDGRDSLLAVGMNREVLPADHGFPARLVVPGLYGYVSATKWITEIELTTWDAFDGYWIPRGWAKMGPVKTQSRIGRPKSGGRVPAGQYVFGGVAWAPNVGIERVEVQVDEDEWMLAELTEPLSINSWIQWSVEADVSEGSHTLRVRATDATGKTQSELRTSPRPDGAEGWHMIRFVATV